MNPLQQQKLGINELSEEYLKVLNNSHFGINHQNMLPYVRNNKLFDWQEF
jgi:hypothetical protein